MPGGRPTIYSDEIVETICERLAVGQSLTSICKEPDMPGLSTVFRWLEDKPEFRERYARAREAQADALDAEIADVARQDPERVTITIGDNVTKTSVDGAEVQHRRLLIDALKWRAAHLKPKVYGDKIQTEHSGKVAMSLEQILASSWQEPAKPDA